ncbi:YuzL family protein [Mesobacillus maritimus]|nr:YuzL family protein [Mesobacillus maritimus]MCM3588092.1 YuzL family protein [Mesobacillus maritimus]MCM3668423.1 YuzL family protein [Mesobacillus maritimus]
MSKRKKNPATIGLNSSQVEGQGTTNQETGQFKAPSSRKKQKRN